MRIEVGAKLILTVPDAGNRSVEDIVLLAEQYINEQAATFPLVKYKNCTPNVRMGGLVGIRLHVKGGHIRQY